MTVVYRTSGAWGAGKGSALTPAEVDGNFYDLASRLATLEGSGIEPNEISNITVTGGQFTIFLEDGTSFGPFALPVAVFQPRDDWTAATDYEFLDLVSIPSGDDAGLYMVLQDHTSDATFDPAKVIGGNPVYHLVVPPGPTGPQGEAGTDGADGATGPQGERGVFDIDASGVLASRSDYDNEDPGFTYLSTDGDGDTITVGAIYIHGDNPGEWDGPYQFQGDKGDQGDPGAGFQPDAIGNFVDRADYNAENFGFSFLSLDGDGGSITTPVIFFLGSTEGDWSDPVGLLGPKGDPGANFNVDAQGTFAERTTHDDEAEGFSYLSTDGDGDAITTGVIFVKLSATSGDWSDAYLFQGPEGPQGPVGPTGASGTNFDVDATGTFAGRTAHDAETAGYAYLSTNGDAGATTSLASIFVKLSGTSGDWSDPIPFQGPKGDTGPTGAQGLKGDTGDTGAKGDPGTNFDPDAIGTFAGRSTYDAQPKDFSYLSTNGDGGANTAASIYLKLSNDNADWSGRIPFQGPKGDQGKRGLRGLQGPAGVGVPTGGTTGQYLRKSSNTNYAAAWSTLPNDLPTGGTTGQVLAKTGDGNYAVGWTDAAEGGVAELPTGGTTGQVLAKASDTDGDVEWTDAPSGSAGSVSIGSKTASFSLALTDGDYIRCDSASTIVASVPANGTVAFDVGTQIALVQVGTGLLSVAAAAGVTINTPETLNARKQRSTMVLTKVDTNEWDLSGDLELA